MTLQIKPSEILSKIYWSYINCFYHKKKTGFHKEPSINKWTLRYRILINVCEEANFWKMVLWKGPTFTHVNITTLTLTKHIIIMGLSFFSYAHKCLVNALLGYLWYKSAKLLILIEPSEKPLYSLNVKIDSRVRYQINFWKEIYRGCSK